MKGCLPISPESFDLLDEYFGDPDLSDAPDGIQPLSMNSQLAASFTPDTGLGRDVSSSSPFISVGEDYGQSIQLWLLGDMESNDSSITLQNPSPSQVTPECDIGAGISLPASDRPAPHTGLPRRRSRYLVQHSSKDTGPIVIPNATAMDPMERWRESPPEDEPASMAAILKAVKETPEQSAQHQHIHI